MSDGATLILGASSDIGLALMERLLPGGGTIYAHYHQSRSKLDRFSAAIASGQMIPVEADFTQRSQIESLLDRVVAKGSPERIVHLPAPKITHIRFSQLDWETTQREIDVQLRSIMLILGRLLPAMAKAKRGKVLFVLSSYVLGVPPKFMSHYITVKYALLGLMAALSSEYAEKGIGINAVSPSLTQTDFLREIPEKLVEMNAEQHPLKRNAVPADLVPLMAMLLSGESNYVSGVNIPIAGGSAA